MYYAPFSVECHSFLAVLRRLPQQSCRREPHPVLSDLEPEVEDIRHRIHLYRTEH